MTQSNTSSPKGSEVSRVPEGVMAIEVPQNEEISGGEKNGWGKGVGFAICRGSANKRIVDIKKGQQGGIVERDIDPYIIRVGIKRKKRGGGKFRKGSALPDKNDDAATSVRGIRRENARPGVGAVRTQSRESRNLERGRRVKIGFQDTDKVDRMGRKKVK